MDNYVREVWQIMGGSRCYVYRTETAYRAALNQYKRYSIMVTDLGSCWKCDICGKEYRNKNWAKKHNCTKGKVVPNKEDIYSMAKDYMETHGYTRCRGDATKIKALYNEVIWTTWASGRLVRELNFLQK